MTGGNDGSQVVAGAADAAGSDRDDGDPGDASVGGFARPVVFEVGRTTLTLRRGFAADGEPTVVLATIERVGDRAALTTVADIPASQAEEMGRALLRLGRGRR